MLLFVLLCCCDRMLPVRLLHGGLISSASLGCFTSALGSGSGCVLVRFLARYSARLMRGLSAVPIAVDSAIGHK